LTEGDLAVAEVARRCGFANLETMRLVFRRHLRVAPQAFRNRFHRPAAIAA
jgi:transcriptional regulator GlxA family with amidase domain